MLYDYDLVVIGDSIPGRWAALSAARQYARVAWVQQTPDALIGLESTYFALCQKLTASNQSLQSPHDSFNATSLLSWCEEYRQEMTQAYDQTTLAEAGVDVIAAQGQFLKQSGKKSPIFEVNRRQLRSPFFLLAPEKRDSFSISTTPDKTYSNALEILAALNDRSEPIHVTNQGVESFLLAQLLQVLRKDVTLTQSDQLLPQEDRDLSFFLQNKLEADGITISTPDSKQNPGAAVTVHLDSSSLKSFIESLQLNHLGESSSSRTSSTLQYLAPHIYACGALWGGYGSTALALKEAQYTLDHALFNRRRPFAYEAAAYGLPIVAGFQRIGLSEAQARHHGTEIQIFHAAKESSGGSLWGKVIALKSGRILGMHLCGLYEAAISHMLESIIQHRVTVTELNQWAVDIPMLHQLFLELSRQAYQIQDISHRDRLEKHFRRKRKQFS